MQTRTVVHRGVRVRTAAAALTPSTPMCVAVQPATPASTANSVSLLAIRRHICSHFSRHVSWPGYCSRCDGYLSVNSPELFSVSFTLLILSQHDGDDVIVTYIRASCNICNRIRQVAPVCTLGHWVLRVYTQRRLHQFVMVQLLSARRLSIVFARWHHCAPPRDVSNL